jgi:hypothetical protein
MKALEDHIEIRGEATSILSEEHAGQRMDDVGMDADRIEVVRQAKTEILMDAKTSPLPDAS